jgi:hypothetical protein
MAVGVAYDTVGDWLRRDESFRKAVDAADFEFMRSNFEFIKNARNESWVPAAWISERKWAQEADQKLADFHAASLSAVKTVLVQGLSAVRHQTIMWHGKWRIATPLSGHDVPGKSRLSTAIFSIHCEQSGRAPSTKRGTWQRYFFRFSAEHEIGRLWGGLAISVQDFDFKENDLEYSSCSGRAFGMLFAPLRRRTASVGGSVNLSEVLAARKGKRIRDLGNREITVAQ